MFLTWDNVQFQFEKLVKGAANEGDSFNQRIETFFQFKMVSVYDSWAQGKYKSIEDVNYHVNKLILKG
ncbi:hypothetical protein [Paenibacillus illinoisensis]|uniref:hypothetical protein n=1 Tax=Paenibacillus illinoisensis TaxID=59845 RepID=UPI0020419D3B|nr:hypothetical protein [Paenibacillus illinoisensis]MCM3206543.1 hypothetical protein [Paenibacillus illinoisensis]